ncbi:MAG TPA: YigZ family protein [Petrotogaceae bacterium]|nr:YigZ family protein [Petrotogaceae bacterium]
MNIERSIFIASAVKVSSCQQAKDFIKEISRHYNDATHNCWAYKIIENNSFQSDFSDDREPSGTAGRPILGAIEKNGIINVAVVVTRYFGGVKLGVRGLIQAYAQSAQSAIDLAGVVLFKKFFLYSFKTDYSSFAQLEKILKREKDWAFKQKKFLDSIHADILIKEDSLEKILSVLNTKVFDLEYLGEEEAEE